MKIVRFKSVFCTTLRSHVVRRRIHTILESVVAFVAVLVLSSIIYLIGRLTAPEPTKTEEKVSMYACGEKVLSQKFKISHTLYKYLIYFVIIDSSAVIIAFASLAIRSINEIFLLVYLFTILASSLLLLGGD